MRVALVQMSSSDDPTENLATVSAYIRDAAAHGADFILTPEVTNCVSMSRRHQRDTLVPEHRDPFVAGLSALAPELGVWILAGSLAVKTGDDDQRFANRSLLFDPEGSIAARYDKIHMFDVELKSGETYQESSGFRPGTKAVLADVAGHRLGMTICYDIRFPHLYRDLAKAGAEMIAVPSAFTRPTGQAHWESLLRARAIETGAFILAPAQTGKHAAAHGVSRETWGHSLVITPWGQVLLDMGDAPGFSVVEIDLAAVDTARRQLPSLNHDRSYDLTHE